MMWYSFIEFRVAGANYQQNLSPNLKALDVPTGQVLSALPARTRTCLSRDSSEGSSEDSLALAPAWGTRALGPNGLRRQLLPGIGLVPPLIESSCTCPQIATKSSGSGGAPAGDTGSSGGAGTETGPGPGEVPKTNGLRHLVLPEEPTLSHSISFWHEINILLIRFRNDNKNSRETYSMHTTMEVHPVY